MEKEIGKVVNFYSKPCVAAIKITDGELNAGDTIKIKGSTTDITQKIDSMQVNNQPVNKAKAGDDVGLKTTDRVRQHDVVYKVTE